MHKRFNSNNYRHEIKFIVDENDILTTKNNVNGFLEIDENTINDNYEIHSLYFDNDRYDCYNDVMGGERLRYKYRIRYYNKDTNLLKLEKKYKINNLCYKKSCELSKDEYNKILKGNVSELLWQTNKELIKEFCLACTRYELKPKIIINYERTAFVEKMFDIRLTIDKNVSYSNEIDSFINNDYLRNPIFNNKHIMEFKYKDFAPGYIRHLIYNNNLTQTSVSKYCMGINRMRGMYYE